jgi:hypothetical protein
MLLPFVMPFPNVSTACNAILCVLFSDLDLDPTKNGSGPDG